MKRTLKSVIDLRSFQSISSDELLSMDEPRYNEIRRAATEARINKEPRFACAKCGHAVYAPLGNDGRRLWRHYLGAPENCPWWTGKPSKVDDVSARQFEGRQEGALHARVKHMLADILEVDALAKDVKVENFVITEDGRRKPDVQALYEGVHTAFEIQLSTTQMPVIIGKENFYQKNNIRLVWVTWDFEQRPFGEVQQAFKDIYFGHNQNIFSLDQGVIEECLNENTLKLRVHAFREGVWKQQSARLSELSWNEHGLPFFFKPENAWPNDFKSKWIKWRHHSNYNWNEQISLLKGLVEKLGIDTSAADLEALHVPTLLDCLYSLQDGRPVVSRQQNLFELANSFLGSKRHYAYAAIFEYVATRCGHTELLQSDSVKKKLEAAKAHKQTEKASVQALIIRQLFPEWL